MTDNNVIAFPSGRTRRDKDAAFAQWVIYRQAIRRLERAVTTLKRQATQAEAAGRKMDARELRRALNAAETALGVLIEPCNVHAVNS